MPSLYLACVPPEHYTQYRYDVIFRAYKWDPQVEDQNTVARHVLLISAETARQLHDWARQLARETLQAEQALLQNLSLAKNLGLPPAVLHACKQIKGYVNEQHVRLMRFDFHPTATGWAVSEVNSDVPGGFAEASVWPSIAQQFFPYCAPGENTAQHLLQAFKHRLKPGARIAFVHATSYADDRQVMQFLSDFFEEQNFCTFLTAPDHIRWKDAKAWSTAQGQEGNIDGIVRFFPVEWLPNLPRKTNWKGYFQNETVACNHPSVILTQSKRLPLVWDKLGLDLPAWKMLLPETTAYPGGRAPKGWIFKPALGRVGEGISIAEAITVQEKKKIEKSARRQKDDWVLQETFISQPVPAQSGEAFHLCIGVFTVDGESAGFYARISEYPRIDAKARDIPVLVADADTLQAYEARG